MKITELNELVDQLYNIGRALRSSKGADYSGVEDTLSNFKNNASDLNSKGYQVKGTPYRGSDMAMQMIVLKINRLSSLRGRVPSNESIQDTILDLLGYIYCYYGCLFDENKENNATHT